MPDKFVQVLSRHVERSHLAPTYLCEGDAAEALYRQAAVKTTSAPERNYLLMKAARLRAP